MKGKCTHLLPIALGRGERENDGRAPFIETVEA
mgnify:CR=1 FL=1